MEVVTGGGTGTYLQDAATGVFTEVQPGSFIFSDADYARNLDASGKEVSTWKHSLFVLGSVMSSTETPSQRWFVLDVGQKAHSVDSGLPLLLDFKVERFFFSTMPSLFFPDVWLLSFSKGATFENGGDEHGKVMLTGLETPMPALNTKVFLIPGHCDPTVNMYPQFVAIRGAVVEGSHPIEAHGPGL